MEALLTVVLPMYNVGRYLAACLDSVAGQTYRRIEVVLVDDGSTDDSAAIAAGYVGSDRRFRLIRQPNRGLGAARNAGIDAGTGELLTFVDTDDVLPPYAFEVLVGALTRSGSDFASGNVALLTSRGLRQSPLHRGTHRATVLRTALTRQRNLVYDRLACNKVFRRTFWDGQKLRFPEGVRYEDIPVTVPAYAMATSVDLIDLPVYFWRQRDAEGERSLSQRQGELRNLVDRFAAVDSASRALAALAEPRLKKWYDETALSSDLRMFLDLLPDVDDAYRQRFLDLAVDFLDRVDGSVLETRLAPRLRIAWRLARVRALPELVEVVAASRHGADPPVVRRGLGRYLALPLLDAGHPAVPREHFRVRGGLRTEVHEIRWVDDQLRVRGAAYDAERGAPRRWGLARMLWVRGSGKDHRILRLPTRAYRTVTPPSSVPYHWAGFAVSLDPRRLRRGDGWNPGDWTFNVAVVRATSVPRKRMLGIGESRPALPGRWVDDGVRVVPYLRRGRLRLRVERPRAWVDVVRFDGADLVLSGSARELTDADTLLLARVPKVVWRSYPLKPTCDPAAARPSGGAAPVRWSARIPRSDLVAAAALTGRPVLVGEAGAFWRVSLGADAPPAAGSGAGGARGGGAVVLPVPTDFSGLRHSADGIDVIAAATDEEVLGISVLPAGPLVGGVELTDGALVLSGDLPAGSPPVAPDGADPGWRGLRVVLRARESAASSAGPNPVLPADRELPAEVTGDRWRVEIRLIGPCGLPDGDWSPLYRAHVTADPVDLPFLAPAWRDLPRDPVVKGRRLEVLPERNRGVLRVGPAGPR
jgi:CDP-glycerol glycerophosphotransferase